MKDSIQRVPSIDRFRGLFVFLMVLFSSAYFFPSLGFLAQFTERSDYAIRLFPGFYFYDLGTPGFMFIIGCTYPISFSHRYEKLGNKALIHFVERYISIMGIGGVVVSVEKVFLKNIDNPLYIQTILMYFSLFLLLALLLSLITRMSSSITNTLKLCFKYSLIAFGVVELILMVRDQIILMRCPIKSAIYMHWSILHSIGFTGLLVIPFLKMKDTNRLLCWLGIIFVYTCVQMIPSVLLYFSIPMLAEGAGCFGFLILMLGPMVLTDLKKESIKLFWLSLALLGIASFISCKFLEIDTRAVTINYILLSLTLDMLLLEFIGLFDKHIPKFCPLLWWGRNSLLLYIIGLSLKLILMAWNPPQNTSLTLAVVVVGFGIAIMHIVARFCYKHNLIIKF